MPLPTAIEGGGRDGILIACVAGGRPVDLSGATLAGRIVALDTGSSRAIAGTLTVSGDPAQGQVLWSFDPDDLVAGEYLVQITASYASGLPHRSFASPWSVKRGW